MARTHVKKLPLALALALLTALVALPLPANAQNTAADFSKGSIQLGYDNRTCDASLEGAIRYNSPYCPNAVAFDGANDYLTTTSLTGIADADQLTGSFWIKPNAQGTDTAQFILSSFTGHWEIWLHHEGTNDDLYAIRVWATTSGGGTIVDLHSNENLSPGNWYHVMFSVDAGGAAAHLYIDDALNEGFEDLNAGNMDFTDSNYGIGAYPTDGANKLDADMAELWIAPGAYIDFSVEANRRKFIDANGMPADLGSDGSAPTGTSPIIFLANDSANWETNLGTGGDFAENGALTDGAVAGLCSGGGAAIEVCTLGDSGGSSFAWQAWGQ